MKTFELIIPGKSVGKQRPRVFNPKYKSGAPVMDKAGQPVTIATTPQKTMNFEATIKQVAWAQKIPMMERCKLSVYVCVPVRRKTFKTKPDQILEPGMRPDADNVFKSCADALEGIAFKNDKHILECHAEYCFIGGDQAYTKIVIEEVKWEEYIRLDWQEDFEKYGLTIVNTP